ncbi:MULTISPECIES: DinB family protein [Ignavibacterium]|jgi:hypothetical protein|uniref:DinB family protein n=1 Tax=Ignavibacterium TaxID=795750 RepID=UPI0025BED7BB|nr:MULTISPECIES: DinB family protein [Ignavibacterium]
MLSDLKKSISSQFLASIKMLENAIDMCPENIWHNRNDFSDFWYIVYHSLFWVDFYLTESPDDYFPFNGIGLSELDYDGILPDKVFEKQELKSFLEHCRAKCKDKVKNLDEGKASQIYKFGNLEMTYLELLLYNLRHLQHHTGQLNLILRQQIDSAPKWVRKTE